MKNEISMFEKKLERLQEQIFKMRGMLNVIKDLKEGKERITSQVKKTEIKPDSGIVFDLHTKKRIE